ncbi:MAG: sirohydrochlorin cobaltochelatase [Deltaproteobacteria bacterium]|jgi:cobalamin biosynthesis Co2+ chelatase CbiK|nr:sirohydrochlorin cobaltochelatase [Deltaproteobacteria bacterium]
MRGLGLFFTLLFFGAVLGASPEAANAGEKEEGHGKTEGIVLAAFGSLVPDTLQSMEKFALGLTQDYPESEVVIAFSSSGILKLLRGRDPGIPSVGDALAALVEKGVERIAVLALYVGPGGSYAELARVVEEAGRLYAGKALVRLSPPLAGSEEDVFTLGSYLIYSMPEGMLPHDAVIFAGRGTENPGSLVYPALNWSLFLQGEKGSLYLALNLEHGDSIEKALNILKANRRRTVWIIPLCVVFGSRAEALFAPGEQSLASRFREAGFIVKPHRRGLLDNPSVANLWKAHLRRTLRDLRP